MFNDVASSNFNKLANMEFEDYAAKVRSTAAEHLGECQFE
jgi:hypothetical protein